MEVYSLQLIGWSKRGVKQKSNIKNQNYNAKSKMRNTKHETN